ncbi:hypothetical protein VE03_06905 [Pseudogymnoascus sp. 23342-1-I1]|nr:hypothetical protein VE03_06905 [Pseudogymnoascus sp. 23342-1-I1]
MASQPPPTPAPTTPATPKIFTHHWTAPLPSHPTLSLRRATPADFPSRFSIISNPTNRIFLDSPNKLWDPPAIADWEARQTGRYISSKTTFDCADCLIVDDGAVVGLCDLSTVEPGMWNAGLILNEGARGRGVGKAVMRAMIGIGLATGVGSVSVGTMRANEGMRGVMRGLGVEGREEDVVIEGRGVVAEVLYVVRPGEWGAPPEVEFGEVLE